MVAASMAVGLCISQCVCLWVLLQVVTFDAGGVSGHANHISLYVALRYDAPQPPGSGTEMLFERG